MYEHIHFNRSFDELDLNASDIQKNMNRLPRESSPASFRHSDFHIDGPVRSLLPVPMTEENRRIYMYIQAFSYMIAKDNYYAIQKNYDSYQLLITHRGKGRIHYEGTHYDLTPGTVFFIDCRKEQYYRTAGEFWELSDLHFYGGRSDFYYHEFFEGVSPLFVLKDTEVFQSMLEGLLRSHTSVSLHREWNVSVAAEALICYLFQSSDNTDNFVPEWAQYLITYIENNYREPLTLDSLAAFTGISKFHLSREFRKYTGFAPVSYINELRLAQAKSLLMQTDIPAGKIGSLVGIQSENNFIRLFRDRNNCTPGEYRRKCRQ